MGCLLTKILLFNSLLDSPKHTLKTLSTFHAQIFSFILKKFSSSKFWNIHKTLSIFTLKLSFSFMQEKRINIHYIHIHCINTVFIYTLKHVYSLAETLLPHKLIHSYTQGIYHHITGLLYSPTFVRKIGYMETSIYTLLVYTYRACPAPADTPHLAQQNFSQDTKTPAQVISGRSRNTKHLTSLLGVRA